MNHNRRAVIGVTAAIAVSGAGCLDFVTGDGPLEEDAQRATVSAGVLSETGYEETSVEELVIEEEVAAGREVRVTNWIATYERTVDLGGTSLDAGQFTVVSTPRFEIAGRAMNPIAELDNEDILEQFLDEYDDLSISGQSGSQTVEMLGSDVEAEQFGGNGTLAGQNVDIEFHIARVDAGDDLVIAVGAYPEELRDLEDEDERIVRMIEGIEHG